ncbi:ribonuclease HI [bacterium]|nr:ribonuclease HI [bacterium]
MNESLLFTDGACSGNPGPGGYGCIAVDDSNSVREIGAGRTSTTNNQMELQAVIEGLKWLSSKGSKKVKIWTDSAYVIQGITSWIFGWKAKGWKTSTGGEVSNQTYWEELLKVTQSFPKGSLKWGYVPAHQGIPGNERCDEIAVQFSKGLNPYLYEGPLSNYSVDLSLPSHVDGQIPKKSNSSPSSKTAKSYLSYLGGVVYRHKDWGSCERRVKGQAGAKFKKSTSAISESEILKSWGLSASTPIKED